ncbi:hypothetical protein, partial [Micromonospora sp. ATCC 39149]|uniref:hypothetical protein n=1 Tax=Micromonospora sp. (strain ATCC 39149 / NRRL 15099 / SCC 1413) TaxID=219305 RepID=UPI00056CB47F
QVELGDAPAQRPQGHGQAVPAAEGDHPGTPPGGPVPQRTARFSQLAGGVPSHTDRFSQLAGGVPPHTDRFSQLAGGVPSHTDPVGPRAR